MADLSDLPSYADRYAVLRGSARRLAHGYFTNFVLGVYSGLRRMDDDRMLNEFADGSPRLSWVLKPDRHRPTEDTSYLAACVDVTVAG